MFLEQYSALIIQNHQCSILTGEGEILNLPIKEALQYLEKEKNIIVIHAPITYRQLNYPKTINPTHWLDILELAAFIHPTKFFGFTPQSFANTLNIPYPPTIDADFLLTIIDHLIQQLKETYHSSETIKAQAVTLFYAQWPWATLILNTLNITVPLPKDHLQPKDSLKIWHNLPKWEEKPPRPPPRQNPIQRKETLLRLSELLGPNAENRAGQVDFADISRVAFAPRNHPDCPNVVLAEAGTGTGKTLGYIAPSTLWSEQNEGTVWINTYTKHLQRQIEEEFNRLYPDPDEKNKHIVVRKGRENYLCLLNLEEQINTFNQRSYRHQIAITLLCRWALETNDGDLFGGDLPCWFTDLFQEKLLYQFAERRGECTHGACPHYQCCFVEHSIQKAKNSNIVIANHALVMQQISWQLQNESSENQDFPTRFIFDEAHHLLDATDNAYAAAFSMIETSELRRWLLGNEGGQSRSKGLKKRIHDVIIGDPELEKILEQILQSAHILPTFNWSLHFSIDNDSNYIPDNNPTEYFFYFVYMQIIARTNSDQPYIATSEYHHQNECDLFPILPELQQQAILLSEDLLTLLTNLSAFVKALEKKLTTQIDNLDKYSKDRIETTIHSIKHRAINAVSIWVDLLHILSNPQSNQSSEAKTHITFLKFTKFGKNILDIGVFHHWLDPTYPFMKNIAHYAHGIILTSATLRDNSHNDNESTWLAAEKRVGTPHLPSSPTRAALVCPFDYREQARVFIVNDVNNYSIHSLADAYLQLFQASKGGALGLFTAISRLRAVYQKIIHPLEEKNLSLFAQHVDPMNNNSLVELFKSEQHSCLLGTDAMRDGINIPGNALRLVVFEKIPWPRPDILHRERRNFFYPDNPSLYDEQIARLRLKQAFGRLIRSRKDKGIFIILDRRTPNKILSAFPPELPIYKMPLEDTIRSVKEFYESIS